MAAQMEHLKAEMKVDWRAEQRVLLTAVLKAFLRVAESAPRLVAHSDDSLVGNLD